MKILFCSQFNLTKSIGTSKTWLELAEELKKIRWISRVVGPSEISKNQNDKSYNECLKEYLKKNADKYDIVEYNYSSLPYLRSEFPEKTLFVARIQLLHDHMEYIKFPIIKTWRHIIGYIIHKRSYKNKIKGIIDHSNKTLKEADLIISLNYEDKNIIVKKNIPKEKITLIPNGISKKRLLIFNKLSVKIPKQPKIAFVGTFDFRKGGADFPKLLRYITKEIPNANFKLLGTKGMYQTKKEVINKFPRRLRKYLEVIPEFKPEELHDLLSNCSVGIFPSYLEGMPSGILEMLAASIPVISYNCPGPGMMLPKKYLVPRGDIKSMSKKVIELLKNKEKLYEARKWAKKRSQDFCWEDIAKKTSDIYIKQLNKLRKMHSKDKTLS